MGKFGVVGDLLSDISIAKVGKDMEIAWIEREKIRKNPKNGYKISNVEALAEDIARGGLAQPLEVMPEDGGGYLLITGERRLTAIDMLIDRGVWTKGIPCFIRTNSYYNLPLSEHSKEMYGILRTNCLNRNKSDADLYFEVTEWGKIISQLKQQGYKSFPADFLEEAGAEPMSLQGRTREITAARANASTGQVAKIEAINKNGIAKLKEAVMDGRMKIAAAYDVSQMARNDQTSFMEKNSTKDMVGAEEIKEFKKALNQKPPASPDSPASEPYSSEQHVEYHAYKEWLRDYRKWGLWYHDPNIDVNYYRCVFKNGSVIIAAEYLQREDAWSPEPIDEVYYHLIEKKKEKSDSKTTFEEKYRHEPTSIPALVAFLKRMEKELGLKEEV